jgi:hypothetical protein
MTFFRSSSAAVSPEKSLEHNILHFERHRRRSKRTRNQRKIPSCRRMRSSISSGSPEIISSRHLRINDGKSSGSYRSPLLCRVHAEVVLVRYQSEMFTALVPRNRLPLSRAKGATHGGAFVSYCRLLPPRPIAKLLVGSKMTGAGDGNRTQRQMRPSR